MLRAAVVLTLLLLAAPAWAALSVATGQFNTGTGAVGTTVSVTSLSFQPKVVLFTWIGRTGSGQAENNGKFGIGYMVSATDRGSIGTQNNHAETVMDTGRRLSDNAAITILTSANAVDGLADFDAWLSNGFRLIIDDVFGLSWVINYIAIGGSDLTNVESVTVTAPSSAGNQNITTSFALDTGIDDKAVIFIGQSTYTINTAGNNSAISFGAAAGNTPVNANNGSFSVGGGAADSLTCSYSLTSDSLAMVGSDVVSARGNVTAWLSNGFTINWSEVSGAGTEKWRALVLKGGTYQVGDALTRTDTSNGTEGTVKIPKGLIVGSANQAVSTSDTTTAHQEVSVGFAASASSRNYSGLIDKDAQATSDVAIAQNTEQMYVNQSTATTMVIEGLMDLISFDATPGFTYLMDDADPVASYYWYLNLADAGAVASTCARSIALLGVGCR